MIEHLGSLRLRNGHGSGMIRSGKSARHTHGGFAQIVIFQFRDAGEIGKFPMHCGKNQCLTEKLTADCPRFDPIVLRRMTREEISGWLPGV